MSIARVTKHLQREPACTLPIAPCMLVNLAYWLWHAVSGMRAQSYETLLYRQ
jgi:hypothetical protein